MAKKKFNPFVLLYVISGILLIISIAPIADTARDIYSTKGRYSGYVEESLFNDFMEKDYSGLVKKINYNKGIGKSISDDEQDYYTFAECYDFAVDYYMYISLEILLRQIGLKSSMRLRHRHLTEKYLKKHLKQLRIHIWLFLDIG